MCKILFVLVHQVDDRFIDGQINRCIDRQNKEDTCATEFVQRLILLPGTDPYYEFYVQ